MSIRDWISVAFRRHRRWLGVVAVVFTAMTVLGFLPVRGRMITTTSNAPTVTVLDMSPVDAPMRALDDLDVKVTTVGPQAVEMVLPQFPGGRRLALADLVDVQDFEPWAIGPDRIVSTREGAEFSIVGAFSYLDLYLGTAPSGGAIRLDVNGTSRLIRLDREVVQQTVVRIQSRYEILERSARFAWHGHDFSFEGSPTDTPTISIGQIAVTTTVIGDGPTTLRASRWDILEGIAAETYHTIPVGLAAVVIVAFAWMVGTAIERLLGLASHRILVVSLARRLGAGIALPLLLVGASHYFIPGMVATWAMIATCGALVLAAVVRAHLRFGDLRPPRARSYGAIGTVALTIFGSLVLTRGMGIGLLHDDLIWYGSPVERFWSTSAISSGSDFGNGLRLFDYTARTVVYGLSGLSFFDSTHALRLSFFLISAACIDEVAALVGLRALRRVAVVLVGSLSAPLLALWVEAYLSREFMATLLPIGLGVTAVALTCRPVTKRELALAGAVMAAPAAIVPNFATIVPVAVVILIGFKELRTPRLLLQGQARLLRPALAYLGGLMFFLVPNLIWLKNPDVTNENAVYANPIGKNIVIPFYDTAAYPATLFGALPFHNHERHVLGDVTGNWVPGLFVGLRNAFDGPNATRVLVAVLALIALGGIIGAWHLQRNTVGERAIALRLVIGVLIVTVVGFLPYLAVWNSQAYMVLMYPLTLASLAVLTLVLCLASVSQHAVRRLGRNLASISLAALVAVNFVSASVEASRWMEGPEFGLARQWHFDMASDLLGFEDLLHSSTVDGVTEASIELGAYEGTWNSDQTWLANEVAQSLWRAGITCVNCSHTERLGLLVVDPNLTSEPSNERLTIVIGARSCGDHQVLRTPSVAACLG